VIHDTLGERLDHSAPASRPAASIDIEAMIADARPSASRRLRPRILITAALTVALASGGVGVAVATDGFSWRPWIQHPVGAVQFEMANGFQCELRYTGWTGGSDPTFVNKVDGILEDWYRSADVLAAIQPLVPSALKEEGPIYLDPGETLTTLPPGELERREFDRQWEAWDLAIANAETRVLASQGVKPSDARMAGAERSSQIQCFDDHHKLYKPGAGS
jgi:hypothetical protein